MAHHNSTPASILEAPTLKPEWLVRHDLSRVIFKDGPRLICTNRAWRRKNRKTARAKMQAATYKPYRKGKTS